MSEIKAQRLSKVARELNVGISTIAEFLSSKGIEIEAKPNSKIEPSVYQILSDEFQSEKSAKEESRKVSMPTSDRESVSLKDAKVDEKSNSDDDDEILIKNVPEEAAEVESPVEEEQPEIKEEVVAEEIKEEEKVEVVEEVEELPEKEESNEHTPKIEKLEELEEVEDGKVKVLGKIDLSSMNMKTRPGKKSKEDRKAEAQKDKDQKIKQKEQEEKEKKEEESKKVAETAKKEVKKEEAKVPEKKEREEFKTVFQELSGPKVVGKIELPKKPEKKPVASSSEDKETQKPKKRRRRRINQPTAGATEERRKGTGAMGRAARAKKEEKPELTDKEIQEQIKETLARLQGGSGKSRASKYRRQKRDAASDQIQKELEEAEAQMKVLKVTEFVTANELASLMDVNVNEVISACMSLGLFVSINQRLDAETLSIVAEEFGFEIEFIKADSQEEVDEHVDTPDELLERYPIVTVMGHVDHGKTSLLDYIRSANVIAGEAGGITQHIGAYNVELESGKHITFLDTPGHEAFTAMRARGAQVTDVAVIVIAADDNVMPQTKEAINHAQAAGVPLVFAINKVDRPAANPEKIKEELSQLNILVEDWGGKYQSQEVSAKSGEGVKELLEKILLESEMLELKANPSKNAVGTVIESSLDKGRGYVTTLIVQAGTMKVGDVILAGPHSGRVKAMFNERGQKVNSVGPSMPVSVLGLSGAPNAGDKFNILDDEREARTIATKRLQLQREQGTRTKRHITLDEIGRRIAIGDFQELNVIVKGDVDGSIEALSDSLLKLSTEQIQVNIIHKSVGQITESDVMLAAASDALIIGFQVRPSVSSRKLAEKEEIDIRLYSIIYDAIEELKSAMEGMLKPKVEERITASIEIRETFKISKVGTIAGCMVLEGKVSRNNMIRIIREGIVVYTGKLGSLKRFKDDVKEVSAGYECGLNIENYNDIKEKDIVEAFEEVEVKQKL